MNSIDNTIEYHELLMTLDDLNSQKDFPLPNGFQIEFWQKEKDVLSWIDIHIRSGEFQCEDNAAEIFHDFYDGFYGELQKRCFFISNDKREKIATATVSPSNEYGYPCVIDWLAISSEYQGKGLGRALIAAAIRTAKDLGYQKILLHTQTTTWLAAKLYLDFGFKPFIQDDLKGWEILKTLTNHPSLKHFNTLLQDEIYSPLMLNVKAQLSKIYSDFTFEVWYKNGRNDVYVRSNGKSYEYKFFDNGNKLLQTPSDNNISTKIIANNAIIGDNIKRYRTLLGYSRKYLAKSLNVSTFMLTMWELDIVKPNKTDLSKLCNALCVSIENLTELNPKLVENNRINWNLLIANILVAIFCTTVFISLWRFSPDIIPAHWTNGIIDRYGKKNELFLLIIPIFIFVLTSFISYFPIKADGSKISAYTCHTVTIFFQLGLTAMITGFYIKYLQNLKLFILCVSASFIAGFLVSLNPSIMKYNSRYMKCFKHKTVSIIIYILSIIFYLIFILSIIPVFPLIG